MAKVKATKVKATTNPTKLVDATGKPLTPVDATTVAQTPVRPSRVATEPVKTITRTDGTLHALGLGNGGVHGATKARDLPWCAGKANVFAALAALGAIGVEKGVTSKAVLTQAVLMGLVVTPRDVRHYTYHAACAGFAGCTIGGAGVGHTYYLTKAGKAELDKHTGK